MAQMDIKDPLATPEINEKLRFEGTVEVGGTVTGEMLSVLFRKESNVNGKLQFQGDLEIDGTFSGAVTTNDGLVVGEHAVINAEISCGSVIVKGDVTGNITARDMVALESGARVKGDINSPSLSIAKGATFDGSSQMGTTASRGKRPNRRT
jgi:cytoskeletal protein CcmA (bactofilin family)